VSAFCCNFRLRAVNDGALKSTAPTITARPTPQEKLAFAALAAQRQVSESTLALIAIRAWLGAQSPDLLPTPSSSGPTIDRITIRLRPGDRLAIRTRAAERRMKDSGYIAALVRGHVAANPPLTTRMNSPKQRSSRGRAALTRRVFRVPRDGPGLFDIASYGRGGPEMPGRFSLAQIAHISRTIMRTPEVMLKVTGGGKSRGAVAAHFGYISRRGDLEMETGEGERLKRPEQHKQLLDSWHLELIAGQYRRQKEDGSARPTKLVHNIVLSMPAPTPADKVLAAARKFARDKFSQHRYAMVLHTDQKHPHVHLVVKAENELGQRLHIDKQRLREWREDFARLMREQGIAANATPRAIRGENKRYPRDGIFKAQQYGTSTALNDRVVGIAQELSRSRKLVEPAHDRLLKTRSALVSAWMKAADVLDAQGEIILAGDVRYFASHLPPVLTDRQRLAAQIIGFIKKQRGTQRDSPERRLPKDPELTR
jgi:hypothetical protein